VSVEQGLVRGLFVCVCCEVCVCLRCVCVLFSRARVALWLIRSPHFMCLSSTMGARCVQIVSLPPPSLLCVHCVWVVVVVLLCVGVWCVLYLFVVCVIHSVCVVCAVERWCVCDVCVRWSVEQGLVRGLFVCVCCEVCVCLRCVCVLFSRARVALLAHPLTTLYVPVVDDGGSLRAGRESPTPPLVFLSLVCSLCVGGGGGVVVCGCVVCVVFVCCVCDS
jgi:hypothetical protein